MAFPNLALQEGAKYHSENEGVPVDGDNEFEHGINTEFIQDHENQLLFNVTANGLSITGATLVGLSADLTKIIINFNQSGVDEAKVEAIFRHSIEW